MPLVVNAVEQQIAVGVALAVLKESGSKYRGDAGNWTALKGLICEFQQIQKRSVLNEAAGEEQPRAAKVDGW